MTERPDVSPEEQVDPRDEPGQSQEENGHPLSRAAEAAAERAVDDSQPREGSEAQRLEAALADKQAELDALQDKFLRLTAEFDNFRKRTNKERMEMLATAGAATLKSILPAVDDMERAIAQNVEMQDIDAVKQGFELIHQKLIGILAAHGVQRMEAKGHDFDPELHDAMSILPATDPELKGKVIEEMQAGYLLNGRVLRHAKVVVAEK